MPRLITCAFALFAVLLTVAPATQARGGAKRAKLTSFGDCGQLVRYAQRHQERYSPGGPPRGMQPTMPPPQQGEGGPVAQPAPSGAPAEDSFSGTNTQEAGVFEPDIVKTNGKLLYAITAAGKLHAVDVTGEPQLLGSLQLSDPQTYSYGHQMLRDGNTDRLLVSWGNGSENTSTLAMVDVSDPSRPTILRTLTVEGQVLAARRTERTVRMVLTVVPQAFIEPMPAEETDRPGVWLPRARFANARTGTSSTRRLVGCRSMRRTRSFSGLESLTVLTINFDKGLDPVDADAILTGGQTVYASPNNLYVATQRYDEQLEQRTDGPVPSGLTTHVHRFSLDNADETTYRGSGTVPGFALNQFSLSEHDGVLRVATTDTPPWFRGENPSQSFVTTLTPEAGKLARLGQVGGIGRGERIFAVRFLGDVGYVVTFEQTDPLFTIDLSKPAAPKVLGELVIPGFSNYLHPIAGDRLIGVGSGPDEAAGTFGLQVSLFDVSDLTAPKLEHRVTFDGGSSEVQYDHHAFLWWQPRDLAVLPVETWDHGGEEPACPPEGPCSAPTMAQRHADAVGLSVKPAGIEEVGRVTHENQVVRRSVIIGDRLLTVSDAGVAASSLADWTQSGFASFGG